MNITIRSAKKEDLNGCVLALENSTLSKAYFQTENSRINAVEFEKKTKRYEAN